MADQKLSALTTAGQLSSTDLLLMSQGIGGTPSSRKLALSALRGDVFNVKDYGAVGDNSTDDIVAVTAAITAAPAGSIIYFPVGIYIASTPIIITKDLHLVGSHNHRSIICCKSGAFTGHFLIKNWSASDADQTVPSTAGQPLYPAIENLFLRTYNNNNITCIGWITINETGFMRDLLLDRGTDLATGCIGIEIYSVDAGSLERITMYTSGTTNGWKSALRVGIGSDLKIDTWVTAPGVYSGSVFYFSGGSNRRMTNIHCEGYTASAASDGAIIRLIDTEDFVCSNSLFSLPSAGLTSRPLLRATNTHTSGYSVSPPVLQDVRIYHEDFTTGNLIEDQTQSANIQNLAASTYLASYIHRYDGQRFWYDDNISTGNVRTPQNWDLHGGLQNHIGYGAIDPPTTGTWKYGDRIWNLYPDYGGYIGWVCIQAGTPGTWQGFGYIDYQNYNLLKQSSTFDNAWTNLLCNAPRAAATFGPTAPMVTGCMATKYVEDNSNGAHYTSLVGPVAAGAHNFSVYVQAADVTKFKLRFYDTSESSAQFDLAAGTVHANIGGGTGTIMAVTGGTGTWYRCSLSATIGNVAGCQVGINFQNSAWANSYAGGGHAVGAGVEADPGFYVIGAQCTVGATLLDYRRRD